MPALVGHRPEIALTRDRRAVHQINVVFPGARVSPQDIGLAIPVKVPHPRHLPVGVGHRPEVALGALDRQTIHRIEIVLPRSRVPPQDVGFAVAIEVPHPGDLPVLIGNGTDEAFSGLDRRAVHEVDVVLPRSRVPPQDVGLAVAVKVPHTHYLPVLVGHRADVAFCAQDRGAIHEVEVVLPGGSVAPHDVGLAVAVEIAGDVLRLRIRIGIEASSQGVTSRQCGPECQKRKHCFMLVHSISQ